jgi:hypothetical protein
VTITGLDTTAGNTGLATLNISADKNSTVNGITSSAANVVLSGGFELSLGTVTLGAPAGVLNRSIDASAMTQAVAFAYTTTTNTAGAAGTGIADTIKTGSGNDSLNLTLTANGNTTITTGTGVDTITVSNIDNLGSFTAGVIQRTTQITDFTKGSDKLDLTAFGQYVDTTGNAAYVGNATLQDFANDANQILGSTTTAAASRQFTSFVFNGSTYIFVSDNAAQVDSTGASLAGSNDGLIQLTNVTGVTFGTSVTNAAADVRFDLVDATAAAVGGLTGLTGTANADVIVGTAGNDTIDGLAGNDTISGGSGNDTLTGGSGSDTLTGGVGIDTFVFDGTAASNTSRNVTAPTVAAIGQFDTITDFVVGTDKLQFTNVTDVVSGQQAGVQTAVTALAVGSTAAQIETAMATANTTDLGVSFAVFGGDTYVLFETTGASTGSIANDIFIKLVGVTTAPTFAADVTP